MIRRLLLDVVLFLLPFVLYGIYWRAIGHAISRGKARAHPWAILSAIGLVLVILSFVWWGLSSGETTDGVYIPPHVEDGEVVPGQFVPDPAASAPEQ